MMIIKNKESILLIGSKCEDVPNLGDGYWKIKIFKRLMGFYIAYYCKSKGSINKFLVPITIYPNGKD